MVREGSGQVAHDGAHAHGTYVGRAKLPSGAWPVASLARVWALSKEAGVTFNAEIAGKSQIALRAQERVVNAGMSSGPFSSGPGFTLLWFGLCVRSGV